MPLDPRIIMQSGNIRRESPVEQYGNALQIQGLQRRNQLQEAQAMQAQREAQQQEAQRRAFASAYNPETGQLDNRAVRNALAASGDVEGFYKLEDRDLKNRGLEVKQEADRLELEGKRTETVARLLQSVNDQKSYERAIMKMKGMGLDVSDIPPQYDPREVQENVQASMSALQQIKLRLEERRTAASERSAAKAPISVTVDNSGQRVPYKIPPGFMLKDESDYRKGVTPVPGGPQDEMSPTDAAKTQMIESSIGSVQEFRQMVIPGDKVDRSLIAAMTAGVPYSKGREALVLIKDAIEAKLRAESGAAVPEPEVERAAERFMPSILDNDATIHRKLGLLDAFMRGTFDKIDPSGRFDVKGTLESIPPTVNAPKNAIDHLRQNPDLAPMFDQKYGPGSAARYLGG